MLRQAESRKVITMLNLLYKWLISAQLEIILFVPSCFFSN